MAVERRNLTSRAALCRRVVGEFDELAGASLTMEDCRRLLQLRDDIFERILQELLTSRVLRLTAGGRIVRGEGSL